MTPRHEIEAFIKEFVKDLEEDSVAIFAGAGMSKGSGYVDWPELMRDIAAELGLKVELEHDLISVAQFHVNQRKTSDGLAKKILQEFSEHGEPSAAHKILARLPIRTYWTTNYDTLIEDELRRAYRVPDVKSHVDQLTTTKPKRDAVVYKMHGDVDSPKAAVLYKEQYEKYYVTHAPFITALSGDLVSKTFLFIGFSFTDPNLDYVLSRLHGGTGKRTHYCFMKEVQREDGDDDEIFKYKIRKQELRIDDLKRFGIQTLLVEDYADIPKILTEVESRFRKKTIFVSGSAEQYGEWGKNEALNFIHALAAESVKSNLRVVNGFGWGIGSAVINGALEAIYGNPQKYSEDQLIVRPFPQHGDNLPALWEEYRQRMISLAGIAIFVFGNKTVDEKIVNANGVRREFEIAIQHGLVPIPVGATGCMAHELWNEVLAETAKFYAGIEWIVPLIKELGARQPNDAELVSRIIKIIKQLNR
ncbi:MAG: SIR2 family protein [Burkholderiales bacterium]|nr:SIR2 family protein [Burkholderiales bacterium]